MLKLSNLFLFAVFFITSNSSIAFADRLISSGAYSERGSCTTTGYCNGYGLNPATNQYEYFYGYFNSCSGATERTVLTYTYQRDDGSTYTVNDAGSWGPCMIQ